MWHPCSEMCGKLRPVSSCRLLSIRVLVFMTQHDCQCWRREDQQSSPFHFRTKEALLLIFRARVSCSSPGWPQMCYVVQDDLELLVLFLLQKCWGGRCAPTMTILYGAGTQTRDFMHVRPSTLTTELHTALVPAHTP